MIFVSNRCRLSLTTITSSRSSHRTTTTTGEPETLSNISLELSGECDAPNPKDCGKKRIQRPKSRKAESCTVKCLTTCIRGDEGEGPFNIRRPIVVFKSGFRSRRYCLEECSEICNLIGD